MGDAGEATVQKSRFQDLIDPIKDLALSWGIDIAAELTNYAESLGIALGENAGIEADFHVQSAPIDFAEAALLVQGSTSVYSRKVEHLYGLVYTAVASLNHLKAKDGTLGNGKEKASEKDEDADNLLDFDKVDFLGLDDIAQVANPDSITLRDADTSQQDPTSLPPVPRTLIRGSTSGNEDLERANFKLLTAHTHSSGALVMEGCPPITENLDALPDSQFSSALAPLASPDDGDVDDGDFPGGFEDDEGYEFSTPPESKPISCDDTDVLVAIASSARKRRGPRDGPMEVEERTKPKRDPFLMLDPHEAIPSLAKPLRVGKTYRKPRRANLRQAISENMFSVRFAPPGGDIASYILGQVPARSSIRNHLCFEGLRSQYRDIRRKKAASRRRWFLKSNRLIDEALVSRDEDDDLDADMGPFEGGPHVSFEDEDNYGGGHMDDDLDDLPALPDLGEEDQFANNGDINEDAKRFSDQFEHVALSYGNMCREHMMKTAHLWRQRAADEELSQRVSAWESRIGPILKEEERRPQFDISAYGKQVLDRFSEKSRSSKIVESSIDNLVHASQQYDVCRLFLATLQLANTYAIEISSSSSTTSSGPAVKLVAQAEDSCAKSPVLIRSKRIRQPGSTPKNVKRLPLRAQIVENV